MAAVLFAIGARRLAAAIAAPIVILCLASMVSDVASASSLPVGATHRAWELAPTGQISQTGEGAAQTPMERAVTLFLGIPRPAYTLGEPVEFMLVLRNESEEPQTLQFRTAQRFDVGVADATGSVVWQWSGDRSFAQVIEDLTLAPGESRTFSVTWDQVTSGGGTATPGTYTAVAVLTSWEAAVSMPATFTVRDAGGSA